MPSESTLPPTLEPQAIFRTAPPRDRRLASLLSVLIYTLLVAGSAFYFKPLIKPEAQPPQRTVTLTFDSPPDSPQPLPPALSPSLTLSSGAEIGTGTIDPALLAKESLDLIQPRSEDIPEGPMLPLEALHATGDRNLPVAPGGNGLPAGDGWTGTRGLGSARIRGVPGLSGGLKLEDLEVVHEEIPKYPFLAEMAGVHGDVVVRVTINEQGIPIYTELMEGPAQLRPETMRAIKLWRFGKGIFRGRKVEATFDITFRYILVKRGK
ncbi:MAG TPA: energy transducer TonB [Geothrix sp.]|nr:energy transducer TonB [Geothrix sp.]